MREPGESRATQSLAARAVAFVRDSLHQEVVVVLAMLVAAAAVLGFVVIAGEVSERKTQAIDERLLRSLRRHDDPARPIGPAWVTDAARDAGALGGPAVVLLVTAGAIGFLVLAGKRHAATLAAVATMGGVLLTACLKAWVERPRPEIVPHLIPESSTSFPSGHSTLAAAVYLTLGALVARELSPLRMRIYVLSAAALVVILVGVSRVVLGVHYPTDVLAGWAAGLAWSLICWVVARHLQRHGAIEGDDD